MHNPLPLRIRPASPEDRTAMTALHKASIGSCLGPYTVEQVTAWTAAIRPEVYDGALRDKTVLVAEAQEPDGPERLLGLGILDSHDGEINAVYVSPEAMGRGVGSQLLAAMEAKAAGRGVANLTVHATLNAVGFYERHGYRPRGDAAHELSDGTALPCVRMVKPLE